MRASLKIFSLLAVMVALLCATAACSKKGAGPKDEDVVKAITAAIESDAKAGTLQSAVVILERGAKVGEDWPFKVEYTLGAPDGSSRKETANYLLTPSINDMGVVVWLVTRK